MYVYMCMYMYVIYASAILGRISRKMRHGQMIEYNINLIEYMCLPFTCCIQCSIQDDACHTCVYINFIIFVESIFCDQYKYYHYYFHFTLSIMITFFSTIYNYIYIYIYIYILGHSSTTFLTGLFRAYVYPLPFRF